MTGGCIVSDWGGQILSIGYADLRMTEALAMSPDALTEARAQDRTAVTIDPTTTLNAEPARTPIVA
jgi:hypothetical protein